MKQILLIPQDTIDLQTQKLQLCVSGNFSTRWTISRGENQTLEHTLRAFTKEKKSDFGSPRQKMCKSQFLAP